MALRRQGDHDACGGPAGRDADLVEKYGVQVVAEIDDQLVSSYADAPRAVSASFDVVVVQHEFGIFGGTRRGPPPCVPGRSIMTDLNGIPIGWAIDGANRHDSILLAPTLDDAAGRHLLAEIETIWLDRGYDSQITRERLGDRGIMDAIIAKKRRPGRGQPRTVKNQPMGLRWPVRANQLVAHQFWSTPTKHRPANPTPIRTTRPRRRFPPHSETHRQEKPLVTTHGPYPLSL